MDFLAIKSENGKGFYIFNNKNEKNEILKQYPGCSHRIFKEIERDNALAWAGVKNISNRKQKVIDESTLEKETPTFISALNSLKKDGYHLAKINLIDGSSFFLILDNFLYLRRSIHLVVGYNTRDNKPCYYTRSTNTRIDFDSLKKEFDSSFDTFQKAHDLKNAYKDTLYECLKSLSPDYNNNKTMQMLKNQK